MQQPFYVGQEVVLLTTVNNSRIELREGEIKTITFCHQCKCGRWLYGIGMEAPAYATCRDGCGRKLPMGWLIPEEFLAPIERAKTKYKVKEVEVAPHIREMEVCQS